MELSDRHLVFGIDGGGSGCRVAVCDALGARLGEISGGPANVTTDRGQTIANVCAAIATLIQDCGISDVQMKSSVAHVGLAGVISPDDEKAVWAAMPFAKTVVSDDRATSIAGALGDSYGVLAAIGTGTIIAAHRASGTRYFGGWGLQISDQASGAWLGQKSYRRAVLAQDGLIEHSDLTRTLLARHGDELVSMIAFAQDATPQDYAKIAPLVVEAARAGDVNGADLMHEGAAYLTSCLKAAAFGNDDILCLSGGIAPHYEAYLEAPYRDRLRPPLGTALDGAVHLAKRLLGDVK